MPNFTCKRCGNVVNYSKYDDPKNVKHKCVLPKKEDDSGETKARAGVFPGKFSKTVDKEEDKTFKADGFEGKK